MNLPDVLIDYYAHSYIAQRIGHHGVTFEQYLTDPERYDALALQPEPLLPAQQAVAEREIDDNLDIYEAKSMNVHDMVMAELARATEKFPTWPTDPLHALAVLGEEFGELTKAMLQHTYEPHKGVARQDIQNEAIQTAAMALRLAISLPHYQYRPAPQHSQDIDNLDAVAERLAQSRGA